MIEESATILAIEGKQLLVQAQPSSACGACHARSACGQGLLSKYSKQTPGQVLIENRLINGESLMLSVGDEVIIGISETSVLSGAFFAYLLPLIFIVAFALLAQLLNIQSEPIQIAMTVLGLLLGITTVKYLLQGEQKYLKNILPQLLRKSASVRKLQVYQEV